MKIISSFLLIFLINNSLSLAPTEDYPNSTTLIFPDILSLYWKYDSYEITFEIHYKYSKWAMFGVSYLNFSDVIMVWLNEDNTGHLSDRYLLNDDVLKIDSEQNWKPIDAFKSDEFTVFKFKRYIKITCTNQRKIEDIAIQSGLVNITFSIGNDTDSDWDAEIHHKEIELLSEKNGPYKDYVPPRILFLQSIATDIYTNSFDLVQGFYKIYWNYSNTEIIAEIHCKTNGWIGFGFSPNGGMDKSDVVIGWISNGQVNFTDRHIVGRQVKIDQKQDWTLLQSKEMNGVKIFKFKRNITACDPEDFTIEKGSPYVIYAYGDIELSQDSDIRYHGPKRGSKKINFISSPDEIETSEVADTEIFDITISNLILPKHDTYYYCKGFKVPKTLTQKRHIYKYEFIFPKINYKNMHHALLYECLPGYDGETPKYVDGECYLSQIKGRYCQSISIGWAIGGQESISFPNDMGYPIGGDTDYSYLVLELHYDNPLLEIGYVENVTLRFYTTQFLRPKELGVLTVGTDSSPLSISIPPKMNSLSIKSYCFNDCLNQKLHNQSLNLIMAYPHTHLSGLEVSTKIIRNGSDIGYLFRNKYYDFNFQNNYLLNPSVEITQNDSLITECIYTTKNRNHFTFGGMATKDEMCFHFFMYYPRHTNFKTCLTIPAFEDVAKLLLTLSKTENITLEPYNPHDPNWFSTALTNTFEQLENKTPSDNLGEVFTQFYETTRVRQVCNKYSNQIHEQIKPLNVFQEVDNCTTTTTTHIDDNNGFWYNAFKSIFKIIKYLFGLK